MRTYTGSIWSSSNIPEKPVIYRHHLAKSTKKGEPMGQSGFFTAWEGVGRAQTISCLARGRNEIASDRHSCKLPALDS
jgi:hypothetical protein